MSNLTRSYRLSIWDDVWNPTTSRFEEKEFCIIGSDTMQSQNKASKVRLVRNVNGEKKLSFEMCSQYIDSETGEKVINPFVKELIAERKVKLEYDNNWYDFIIKDISENSSTYVNTYSLEDAIVQELSKNGFGVTLDADLMNNIGDAKTLAETVLKETDWIVEQDIPVQLVEEALVYLNLPRDCSSLNITQVLDQTNLQQGVTVRSLNSTEKNALNGKKILGFYSCCKNKPHRFQFIYSSKGYGKTNGKYDIDRNDQRFIVEKNCQYYITFSDPSVYTQSTKDGYDLFLPAGITLADQSGLGLQGNRDTQLSSWYRGNRYGFAQQAVYVPVLDKYCKRYTVGSGYSGRISINTDTIKNYSLSSFGVNTNGFSGYRPAGEEHKWSGAYINTSYTEKTVYTISYDLSIGTGTLRTIGGHNASFDTFMVVRDADGTKLGETRESIFTLPESWTGNKVSVYARYVYKTNNLDSTKQIFIQPNRGYAGSHLAYSISNLKISYSNEYLGFEETEFVSPTTIQNYISNPKFSSTSGWVAGITSSTNNTKKPKIEAVTGYFTTFGSGKQYLYSQTKEIKPTNTYNSYPGTSTDGKGWHRTKSSMDEYYSEYNSTTETWSDAQKIFCNIIDDLATGQYSTSKTYKSYLKVTFSESGQCLINSGIRDNRTAIGNMAGGEKWVLDYKILDNIGVGCSGLFSMDLGDYIYNTGNGLYEKSTHSIVINAGLNSSIGSGEFHQRQLFEVASTAYTNNAFKRNSKVALKIATSENSTTGIFYIANMSLYRHFLNENNEIISPDYEQQHSNAAEEFIKGGVLRYKYHYFPYTTIDPNNPYAVIDKDELAMETYDSLNYNIFSPIYNSGARKIRTASGKESNFFNLLQSIAETFEQWLVLEINRNATTGAITSKKVKFKNYSGDTNYAGFRYGVNLKDIQRTYSTKDLVTKLYVKQNSNELAEDGLCTIQRAGANPTGESYIYDFQYYLNQNLIDLESYLKTIYQLVDSSGSTVKYAAGKDAALWNVSNSSHTFMVDSDNYNILGYYPRLKKINDAIEPLNKEIIGLRSDLLQRKAELDVANATYEAATEGLEETANDFFTLTGVQPTLLNGTWSIAGTDAGTYAPSFSNYNPENKISVSASVDNTKKQIKLTCTRTDTESTNKPQLSVFFDLKFYLLVGESYVERTQRQKVVIEQNAASTEVTINISLIDQNRSDVSECLTKYSTLLEKQRSSQAEKTSLQSIVNTKEGTIRTKEALQKTYLGYKKELNKEFFKQYSRFIQEGTWIDEEQVDDDNYYADAQLVLYNSCYPNVQYSINVCALSGLDDYNGFNFALGEKTWIIDEDFFGGEGKEEVIITEIAELLDDPSQDTIQVQNFKNQFQDLFQKITATVQQAQYNNGAYERGAALATATESVKNEFVTSALNNTATILSPGKLQEWTLDTTGLTIQEKDTPTNQIKIVGGGILLSKWDDAKGESTWKTGITCDGITADLITSGRVDTGIIQIMNGTQPTFRWDTYGISAYDPILDNTLGLVTGVDGERFVRFDKNGIYGIDHYPGVNGQSWSPENLQEVINKATFALTWEGLKVTGENTSSTEIIAKIGKDSENIINITKTTNKNTTSPTTSSIFKVKNNGDLVVAGTIEAKDGHIGGWSITQDTLSNSSTSGALRLYGEGYPANRPTIAKPREYSKLVISSMQNQDVSTKKKSNLLTAKGDITFGANTAEIILSPTSSDFEDGLSLPANYNIDAVNILDFKVLVGGWPAGYKTLETKVNNNQIVLKLSFDWYTPNDTTYEVEYEYTITTTQKANVDTFYVLQNGDTYITSGKIGDWTVLNGKLTSGTMCIDGFSEIIESTGRTGKGGIKIDFRNGHLQVTAPQVGGPEKYIRFSNKGLTISKGGTDRANGPVTYDYVQLWSMFKKLAELVET